MKKRNDNEVPRSVTNSGLRYNQWWYSCHTGVGLGGGFFITQLVLAVVFKTDISPFQWAGIASIVLGIFLLAKG